MQIRILTIAIENSQNMSYKRNFGSFESTRCFIPIKQTKLKSERDFFSYCDPKKEGAMFLHLAT